ncbi:MAG: hypothetical protein O9315_17855 [Beijerinckiaceae bacterium]|nr:hypothetical protein [Brevundimonas sp.]MCZ8302106.1 hypothetical protein [Beijerinckiaceae bacterium]
MIDGAPEIVLHAVDLDEDLVEIPTPMPKIPHRLDPTPADLGSENRPEPAPPETHRFMRDVDPPLVQKVLDVPQRERVADLHHHRQTDDLQACLEIPKDAGVAHPVRPDTLPVSGKPIFL